jgi:hypothetical protein
VVEIPLSRSDPVFVEKMSGNNGADMRSLRVFYSVVRLYIDKQHAMCAQIAVNN